MRIVQLTPGAGGMFCGNCFRDNALVAELRRQGQSVLMLPLYLPLKLDEPDQSAGKPIFYGGINVFFEQKSDLFRRLPGWVHRLLDSPGLLRLAGTRAAKTRAEDVGALAVSMLEGELGRQTRELDELTAWLNAHERPDVVCLSNGLLVGMARQLRRALGTRIACMLQGEDTFLDALPPADRAAAWRILAERCAEVDVLYAASRYYAETMARRLGLLPERVAVIHNGVNPDAITPSAQPVNPPVLGYFARMCQEKGLDLLVEAYLLLRQRNRVPGLRLKVGGGLGPGDVAFVETLKARLGAAGVLGDVEFQPNVDHAGKVAFFRSISVLSVPAHYGEAFGLYLLEAFSAGVPAVQPRTAAFTEIIELSGAGRLCEPHRAPALAEAIEALLLDPAALRACGENGRRAVEGHFSAKEMARRLLAILVPGAVATPA